MNTNDITARLTQLIREVKPGADPQPDSHLRTDLGFDSLDAISFFFETEKAFDLKLPEADIARLELLVVSNLARHLGERTGGAATPA